MPGVDPTDGVYLIPLAMSGPAADESDMFWFVMNLNMPEEMHEAATEFVEENLAGSDPCHRDLDGSTTVDFADVLAVLSAWGVCEGPCPEDQDDNGVVDFSDLLIVLASWS